MSEAASAGGALDAAGPLPLRGPTPEGWAALAASRLPEFLADHAVCEQQAAVTALGLVGHYTDDDELVDRLSALAAEELSHFRRVVRLLRRRGWPRARRRPNPWVRALRERVTRDREPLRKVDRLLVCALIEARSCERFTQLGRELEERDPEVAGLLHDLGPAEARHWRLFHDLAAREIPPEALEARWGGWLDYEWSLTRRLGREPTVHG